MRPSGTAGAALLVLLVALFQGSLALEEKKGKDASRRFPRPLRSAPSPQPPRPRSGAPARRPAPPAPPFLFP
jgi:hypothetical protein